ncbi:MAG TPA: DUF3221 domain-containing protein, partial [Bacillota bacterium]|nr:DUF3221 domain-containing protein [Bacillota bacterium]
MKKVYLIIISSFLIVLASCSEQADVSGIVINIEEDRLLVAQQMTAEEYDEVKDQSATDIQNKDVEGETNFDLIVLTYEGDIDSFAAGDEIDAWINEGVMMSYPA